MRIPEKEFLEPSSTAMMPIRAEHHSDSDSGADGIGTAGRNWRCCLRHVINDALGHARFLEIVDVGGRKIINGNPHAYLTACSGMDVSGFLLIPFAFFLKKTLEPFAPELTVWAGRLFLTGAIFLTLSALIVPGHYRILNIGRSHEHLAQISSIAFCLSLILYFGAIRRLPPSFYLLRTFASFVLILPVGTSFHR